MNKTIFSLYYDIYKCEDSLETIKIAFIGNSKTLHDPSKEIGWNHKTGMAASSLENDFVHKTVKILLKIRM